ncbi:ABC transporter substrate-binding protein [Mollicutes bacterium LVI A0039]|nr:ABC transporter substrate-binding protein [Mollicutes bacterium LVI A0039]
MKKILGMLAVLVILLAGCNGTTSSSDVVTELTEPVEIEFWHAMNGINEETLNTIIENYNSSQDIVTVKAINQGAYKDLDTKIQSAGQAGQLPTLAQGYPNSIYEYIQNDWVTDLAPYAEVNAFDLDIDNFIQTYVDEVTGENGELHAIPFNKSTELLFYNEDMLKEAGVEVPTTVDELFTASEKLYEKTGKPGLGFDSLNNLYATLAYNSGITSWETDGEFNLNDEKIIGNVTRFQEAIKSGSMRTAGEDVYMSGPFANQDVAMFIGSSAGTGYVKSGVDGKFNWSVAEYPTESVIQQGTSIAVFNTATAEEQAAAVDFLQFLTNDESMNIWTQATGYLPATTSALESAEYQKFMEGDASATAAANQVDNMQLLVPVFGGSQEIYSVNVTDTMKSILEGGEDVKAALDDLNQEANDIYARNN